MPPLHQGASSPVPVLLTRLDIGHMRRRSSAAEMLAGLLFERLATVVTANFRIQPQSWSAT